MSQKKAQSTHLLTNDLNLISPDDLSLKTFFMWKLDFPIKITFLLHMALNLCKSLSAPACTGVIYECGD